MAVERIMLIIYYHDLLNVDWIQKILVIVLIKKIMIYCNIEIKLPILLSIYHDLDRLRRSKKSRIIIS